MIIDSQQVFHSSGDTRSDQTMNISVSPGEEKVIECMASSDGTYMAYVKSSESKVIYDASPWIKKTLEAKLWHEKYRGKEGYRLQLIVTYEGRLALLFWIIQRLILEFRKLLKEIKRRLRRR